MSLLLLFPSTAASGTAWTQNLSDTVTFSDAIAKTIKPVYSDTVTYSDSLGKSIAHPLADTITLSDALAKSVAHPLSDTVTFSDALSNKLGKGLSDSLTFSDAVSKAITHPLSDTITFSDNFNRTMQFVRALNDALTFSDLASPVKGGTVTLKYYYDVTTGKIILKPAGLVEGTIFRGIDGKEYKVINSTVGLLEKL